MGCVDVLQVERSTGRYRQNSNEHRIEVNLFDFDEMIYGQELSVAVYNRIRSEQSFESLEALKEQLEHDKEACHHILY